MVGERNPIPAILKALHCSTWIGRRAPLASVSLLVVAVPLMPLFPVFFKSQIQMSVASAVPVICAHVLFVHASFKCTWLLHTGRAIGWSPVLQVPRASISENRLTIGQVHSSILRLDLRMNPVSLGPKKLDPSGPRFLLLDPSLGTGHPVVTTFAP